MALLLLFNYANSVAMRDKLHVFRLIYGIVRSFRRSGSVKRYSDCFSRAALLLESWEIFQDSFYQLSN